MNISKSNYNLLWAFFLAGTICFSPSLSARSVDSLLVNQITELRNAVDSLRQELENSEKALVERKPAAPVENDFDKLIETLHVDEKNIPEDQRSRRRRLDGLLQAITERPGQLRFNGAAAGILQGSTKESNEFTVGLGSLDIYAHTAFGPNSLLFVDLQAKGGNGADNFISALNSLNANSGSTRDQDGIDRLTILEAWAEFSAFREVFHITAGKIDLSNYFDINALANDETSQFISASFGNSAAIPFPVNGPGVRIRTEIPNLFFVQFGMSAVNGMKRNIFNDLFQIGSIGLRILANTDFEGNLRVYGYSHPAVKKHYGYGLSFDKALIRSLAVFTRWNRNESRLAEWSGIRSAWSTGVRFLKIILDRYFIIGLAYGVTQPEQPALRKEKLAEGYARIQLNTWTYLSPHIQYVRDAGGIPSRNIIWGVRTQFEF